MTEKKNYAGIDLMKFAAAFLVTAIHIPLFQDVDLMLHYYFTMTLCRLAVPFFFVCAGYFFADKLEDGRAVRKYAARLLALYGVWTLLYLPQILYGDIGAGKNVVRIVRELAYRFAVTGSYTQFWYFPAIIVAVYVVYFVKGKCHVRDQVFIPVVCVLYFCGVMGNSYYGLLKSSDGMLAGIYERYFSAFETTRNGVFFGLFYLYMGIFIRNHMCNWRLEKRRLLCWLGSLAGFALMLLERAWLLKYTGYTMADMTFMMAPAVFFLMLSGLTIRPGKKWEGIGKKLRSLSTLIFCSHLWVDFYLHKILAMAGLGEQFSYSLYWFGYVYIGSLIFSVLILHLSGRKGLGWLKILY